MLSTYHVEPNPRTLTIIPPSPLSLPQVRRRETLLMHCKLCATRAVATHFLLHCHDVTEPHTLCPILTLLARY